MTKTTQKVLEVLAGANVNVANVNVARSVATESAEGRKKLALCFMALDQVMGPVRERAR